VSALTRPKASLSLGIELAKLFIPITLILSLIMVFHYRYFVDTETRLMMRNERLGTEQLNQVVTSDIANVISDTQLLADYFQQLMSSQLTVADSSRQLLTQFLLMSKHRRLYDHIRLLDIKGNEIIRVNFNDGVPEVVPKALLQNKSDRYYFTAINQLTQGEIYISPMDLNIEGEAIEIPLKPTIRSGVPLYQLSENSTENEKIGVLILNYDARNLIARFKQTAGDNQDHVMLINHEGYWLISPDPNDNWGFMFDQDHTFKNVYPEEWLQMSKSNHGQVVTDESVFLFSTVLPYSNGSRLAKKNYWKIISQISAEQLKGPQHQFYRSSFPVYLVLLAILLLASMLIARYRVIHHKAELQATYESRFRKTLEDIQLIAVTINAKGTITFCNERLLHLSKRAHNKVIGQNWFELFLDKNECKNEQAFIDDVLEINRPPPEPHECCIIDARGQSFLVSWSVTPIRNADNQAIGITLIGEDITQKRQVEAQLLTLDRAVEQSPSTVMITDTRGNIKYVNKKFEDLTGYTKTEIIGKKPSILKSGYTDPNEYRTIWKTIWDGNIWHGELKNRKKNGEYYWEQATIAPVRNAEGEIIHFISLKEDITEKKKLEVTLEERDQQVQRNSELAAVGRMANMIAHDLRNPLSSVKLSLQMIGKTPVQNSLEQVTELTDISLEQISYMESIITDVMNYSRPDALQQEWSAIPQLIDNILVLMQRTITEHQAEITTIYQPGLPTVFIDCAKFQQVITNLISNAIQSVDPQKGQTPQVSIAVSWLTTNTGSKVKIQIKDNGKGIDPCTRGKAFEPFFTNKAKGTGLGLAIVKRYVELHDGSVTLEPITGGGSCATMLVPVMAVTEAGAFEKQYSGQAH